MDHETVMNAYLDHVDRDYAKGNQIEQMFYNLTIILSGIDSDKMFEVDSLGGKIKHFNNLINQYSALLDEWTEIMKLTWFDVDIHYMLSEYCNTEVTKLPSTESTRELRKGLINICNSPYLENVWFYQPEPNRLPEKDEEQPIPVDIGIKHSEIKYLPTWKEIFIQENKLLSKRIQLVKRIQNIKNKKRESQIQVSYLTGKIYIPEGIEKLFFSYLEFKYITDLLFDHNIYFEQEILLKEPGRGVDIFYKLVTNGWIKPCFYTSSRSLGEFIKKEYPGIKGPSHSTMSSYHWHKDDMNEKYSKIYDFIPRRSKEIIETLHS